MRSQQGGRLPSELVAGFRRNTQQNRTLLDERFRVECRRTWLETIEEMQAVLDTYMESYNRASTLMPNAHEGYVSWERAEAIRKMVSSNVPTGRPANQSAPCDGSSR